MARVVRDLPDGTRFLMLEYDSPHFSENFAVFTFPVLAGGIVGEVRRLLEDGSVVVPSSIYDASRFEVVEPWDTASDLLEKWLLDRWAVVPGPRPAAFVAHHDSHVKTNLADGARITADEIGNLHFGP